MIHLFQWKLEKHNEQSYLVNTYFWIEVMYNWTTKDWTFFLYPLIDDRSKSIFYFARDSAEQKHIFESIIKISWIGPKTAFHISNSDQKELTKAVESMNIAFFQKIPGVWPKTAKRLVVELKTVVNNEDLLKIQWNEKVIKDIIKYCKWLWYDSEVTKEKLSEYEWEITKKTTSDVIKWLIARI